MVIWVFAGGGPSERNGLIPWLQKTYPGLTFIRRVPAKQKPGPRPDRASGQGEGHTGKSLARQIDSHVNYALRSKETADVILVVDDLDCADAELRQGFFLGALDHEGIRQTKKIIAFAAPELESWLIADWDGVFATEPSFRHKAEAIRVTLSRDYHVPFDEPESFGNYVPERDACDVKPSDCMISACEKHEVRFAKGRHTPEMILRLNKNTVQRKCPHFAWMIRALNDL